MVRFSLQLKPSGYKDHELSRGILPVCLFCGLCLRKGQLWESKGKTKESKPERFFVNELRYFSNELLSSSTYIHIDAALARLKV